MWPEKIFALWFTGLPCSGKTTLSNAVKQKLDACRLRVEQLDGDSVRQRYAWGLGFTKEDRMKNIRHIVSAAAEGQQKSIVPLVSVISPYASMREYAREKVVNFIEVFVRCPLSVCEARDVKGMYRLARQGKIRHFTGVSDPYEEPRHAELVLDTDRLTVEASVTRIMAYLEDREFISSPRELAQTRGTSK